jgi:hypothetical protein
MAAIDARSGMAYCTEDYEEWFCEKCFEDYRRAFEWIVVEAPDDDD